LSPTARLRRAHLVGLAGSGMRSLAQVLLDLGCAVTGSDLAPAEALARMGLGVCPTHDAQNVPSDADLVVYSDAVAADNPELRRAAELGIPTCSYFQMLGRLMAQRHGIAIAGTHGKSTTTAMLAQILILDGQDPTVVFGAAGLGQTSGGRAGRGPLMVAEACEYRANFLHLQPQQAAILGIEPDHFDYYATFGQLQEAFARFAARVPHDGLLLVRHDDPVGLEIAQRVACRVQTFGTTPEADWSARIVGCERGCYQYELGHGGHALGRITLQVPGRHQVLNSLAAAALAWENGVGMEAIAASLAGFRGLHRRLEPLGTYRGVLLVDDYAHHPTEVAATLEAVRGMCPGRRLWCVFQPHQVSRTAHLLDELAASLENADSVVVAEIFRAREPAPTPGEVTAADLAARLRARGRWAADVHTNEAIVQLLASRLEPGDVLITMGAGDIRKICHGFIDWLREDRAAS
jgi:UDP-N-acetylmuramate--alanine ligase